MDGSSIQVISRLRSQSRSVSRRAPNKGRSQIIPSRSVEGRMPERPSTPEPRPKRIRYAFRPDRPLYGPTEPRLQRPSPAPNQQAVGGGRCAGLSLQIAVAIPSGPRQRLMIKAKRSAYSCNASAPLQRFQRSQVVINGCYMDVISTWFLPPIFA